MANVLRAPSTPESLLSDFLDALALIGDQDPILAISGNSNSIYAPIRWALRHALFEDDPASLSSMINLGLGLDWPVAFRGGTPLHEAALVGAPRCARLLLSLGADPNAQSSERLPPLQLACQKRRADVCRILRRAGAVFADDPSWTGDSWHPIRSAANGINIDFHGSGHDDVGPLLPGSAPIFAWAGACGFPLSALLEDPPSLAGDPDPTRLGAPFLSMIRSDPAWAPLVEWARSRSERRALRGPEILPGSPAARRLAL